MVDKDSLFGGKGVKVMELELLERQRRSLAGSVGSSSSREMSVAVGEAIEASVEEDMTDKSVSSPVWAGMVLDGRRTSAYTYGCVPYAKCTAPKRGHQLAH